MSDRRKNAAPTGIGSGVETEMLDSERVFSISAQRTASESAIKEPLLPRVEAARLRDAEARARIARGEDYRPTSDDLLEERAWRGRGRR
ncbi:hypothetical protein IYW40_11585 [Methylocystis sp. H4A]|uniref:hypothetical protein n=1 Tax=Methylocystis sp. H4A TaxID=2785788 RepID=UPI0018C2A2C4|nr:hypothetical protein [Methylocystis sp. H4A]MBG0802115.1 hypothetical protein [Methylocystis sp. H4A]